MIVQLINTGQSHCDILIFHLIERNVVVAKRRNPGALQIFHGIIVSPVSVVMAVVVCQIRRFHRSICQDFRVRRVSLKGKLLILPGIPVRQGTFQVNAGQIVRREGIAYILKKPGSPVLVIGRVKAGVIGKVFICAQNTVAGKAHQDTGGLCACRRRRCHRGRAADSPHTFCSCSGCIGGSISCTSPGCPPDYRTDQRHQKNKDQKNGQNTGSQKQP